MRCAVLVPEWNVEQIFLSAFARSMGSYQEPSGPLYVAAALLQAGHEVIFADGALRSNLDIVRHVAPQQPVFVGLYVCAPLWPSARELLAALRRELPAATLAIGGPWAVVTPRQCLEESPELDLVFTCEGEEATPQVLEALQAGGELAGKEGGELPATTVGGNRHDTLSMRLCLSVHLAKLLVDVGEPIPQLLAGPPPQDEPVDDAGGDVPESTSSEGSDFGRGALLAKSMGEVLDGNAALPSQDVVRRRAAHPGEPTTNRPRQSTGHAVRNAHDDVPEVSRNLLSETTSQALSTRFPHRNLWRFAVDLAQIVPIIPAEGPQGREG